MCGQSASVVYHTTVTDPTIRQPGFDLPRHTWSPMNRFRTGQGPCRANLHKWGLAQSPSCDCGQQQTMKHIVDTCPLRLCPQLVQIISVISLLSCKV